MPALKALLDSGDALTRQVAGVLAERFGAAPDRDAAGVYVPGRVEFMGKHTDYAGGRSLLMAVDRGFRLAAVPRDDKTLRVVTAGDVQEFAFGQTPPHEAGHWINYVATVARRVHMNFASVADLRGADIAFASDLPVAAGMSSSSALMVATFLGISGVNCLDRTDLYRSEIGDSRLRLAEYLGCVENGQSFGKLTGEAGVGTFGGSEDHTAMLCCKANMLTQCSFAPSVFEQDIPFPSGVAVLVGSSGVVAVKTAAAKERYNRASLRARKAAAAFNKATGGACRHLRDIADAVGPDGLMDAMDAIRRGTEPVDAGEDIPGRFEQFFREDQQLIPAVADALKAGRVEPLGELLNASHAGAAHGLQNQVPETNFLQKSARRLGAIAASAFGAGFGGSVWAMVPNDRAAEFIEAWKAAYAAECPEPAERSDFFAAHPGPAAKVL